MSRFAASPLVDDRSTKRTKTSTTPEMDQARLPDNITDVVPDGDVVLVLHGMSGVPEQTIGVRVSSHSLSQASPVFKTTIASARQVIAAKGSNPHEELVVDLQDDNGDAVYLLTLILHLRNDKLPSRLAPNTLWKVATLANKYQCVVSAGRATVQWFDHLYASTDPLNVWEIVEAAYLLDEPMFFARFSSRWVLQQSVFNRQLPAATSQTTQKLALLIAESQILAQTMLRNDLDALADTAIQAFSKGQQHYIDFAPEMSPDPDDLEDGKRPTMCRVDSEAACEYLGALRDDNLYPSTRWERPGSTIEQMVNKVKAFREPEYNDADKCEFCEDIRSAFTKHLNALKFEYEKRNWGMCLDCFKAPQAINERECRFEHPKRGVQARSPSGETNGLGIGGL